VADIGTVERRRRSCLTDETLVRGGVLLHRRRKEFQGELAMKRCVLGQEYLSHPALADLLEYATVAQCLADQGESLR